ncbi:DNA (cytosine-5-)-methyltransferase [Lactococcus lactis subsp. lactis]|uniref:DNA (cytosine-5-)-methyltransferase n=1 Tax=Lactococcus lactis TaxID=1358 RepID=UPI002648AAAD|nr:DNA (cytosine-5-)-methyltransferase [Lactococcus lactis]WKB49214.1 DNA (cytosine-5-)-methyltransferase [Lactococcus lactis subsp. lactis]
MKFLDLFAGIGGFRLGLEQAGHECVGFCEIDKFARHSYKSIHNTEGEREYHDITTVSNEEWRTLRGTVELICGGFPCQAFSIAGKRKGFLDETRGTLFFEIARAAEQIKPRTLFLENVRGLLSHDKGRTFRTIISTLDELGYDAEWQILNSKNFGVPQNRERVFIIGHLRGERGREVFPITRENSGAIDVVNKESGMPRETNRVYSPEGLSPTLNTMQGGGREPKIAIKIKEATKQGYAIAEQGDSINFSLPNSKTRRGRVSKKVAQTLDTSCNQAVIVQKPRGFNKGGEHEVAPTLSSNSWHENNLLKSGMRIRKLTPRECWRLQGFPDWAFDKATFGHVIPSILKARLVRRTMTQKEWKLYQRLTRHQQMSNSQLYKQAGNSVTVPVIYEIARRFE